MGLGFFFFSFPFFFFYFFCFQTTGTKWLNISVSIENKDDRGGLDEKVFLAVNKVVKLVSGNQC